MFGLHPPSLASAVTLSRPIYESYFRVDSVGVDQIPASGPAILVANHAGFLPVDSAMLCLDVLRRSDPPRIPRAVADYFVPRLPLVTTFFARLGVISGTRANVRRLLGRGELVAIWPEGVTGPAKRFRDRYRIQSWRVGFAELAIRYDAPVVPVAIVGAEESWPLLTKLRGLPAFGAPYIPIPASPVPLPVHYHLRYGAPMQLGREPADASDPGIVTAAAIEVRLARDHRIDRVLHGIRHRCTADRGPRVHAQNVDATRELVLACLGHPTIRRLVYRSFAEVYALAHTTSNLLDEEAPLDFDPTAPQWVRDRVEADLTVCAHFGGALEIAVLRCAEILALGRGASCGTTCNRVCVCARSGSIQC